MHAHFIPSGTRDEQEYLEELFLHGVRFFLPIREGVKAQTLALRACQRLDTHRAQNFADTLLESLTSAGVMVGTELHVENP